LSERREKKEHRRDIVMDERKDEGKDYDESWKSDIQ
jgi:hypothetical protein